MIAPRDYKFEDSTIIFDKTQPEMHRFKDNTYQGALVLRTNQSSDQLPTNLTEINPSNEHGFRANKILVQQRRQIENLKKRLRNITQYKVTNVEKTSDLEKLFMD